MRMSRHYKAFSLRSSEYPFIEAAANTEECNTQCAESEGKACVAVRLECWERLRIVVDVHCLHDQKIVVK